MIQMILLAMVSSALVAAMFWDPKMDAGKEFYEKLEKQSMRKSQKPERTQKTKRAQIGEVSLEDSVIHIDLRQCGFKDVREMARIYKNTPVFPLIEQYTTIMEKHIQDVEEDLRRLQYLTELTSKGYCGQQLEPLRTDTLEKILDDLR